MRILHTSDWHLGRPLADADRTEDYRRFLDWLLGLMAAESVNVLVLAGDVFDTAMPPVSAQRLYFDFLRRASELPEFWGTIVAAGNHDSLPMLQATGGVLGFVRATVSGATAEEEAVLVRDREGRVRLGVAAVPYLREGDVRMSGFYDDETDRARRWGEGVARHYREAAELLDARLRAAGAAEAPRIATAHLFVTGSRTSRVDDGRSVPAVFAGALRNVSAEVFGSCWDYIALGHIHHAQSVSGPSLMRYPGSPLMLSFDDLDRRHEVILADFPNGRGVPKIRSVDVPQPRWIGRIRTSADGLEAAFAEARRAAERSAERFGAEALEPIASLECERASEAGEAFLIRVRAMAARYGLRLGPVRRIRGQREDADDALEDDLRSITPEEVFEQVLEEAGLSSEKGEIMRALFKEARQEAEMEASSGK